MEKRVVVIDSGSGLTVLDLAAKLADNTVDIVQATIKEMEQFGPPPILIRNTMIPKEYYEKQFICKVSTSTER